MGSGYCAVIIAGTGHRPKFIKDGYSILSFEKLQSIADKYLRQYNPTDVISGMAQGWDMALAAAAKGLGIKLHVYLPSDTQPQTWPKTGLYSQAWYQHLLNYVTAVKGDIVVIQPMNYKAACIARDKMMVDNCDLLLAFGNPAFVQTNSGTWTTIRYAEKKNKQIVNVFGEY